MHTYVSSVLGELLPGLVLALIGTAAAVPPYAALRHSARGRARSSIGYLMGLGAGLAMTIVMVALLRAHGPQDALAFAGLLGSFFGPFFGMLRAKRQRKHRPRRRVMVEGLSP
jgi:xanthosine utilization system XapX-like protein